MNKELKRHILLEYGIYKEDELSILEEAFMEHFGNHFYERLLRARTDSKTFYEFLEYISKEIGKNYDLILEEYTENKKRVCMVIAYADELGEAANYLVGEDCDYLIDYEASDDTRIKEHYWFLDIRDATRKFETLMYKCNK